MFRRYNIFVGDIKCVREGIKYVSRYNIFFVAVRKDFRVFFVGPDHISTHFPGQNFSAKLFRRIFFRREFSGEHFSAESIFGGNVVGGFFFRAAVGRVAK